MKKSQVSSVELVESGSTIKILAIIPVLDIKDEAVPCPHKFSRHQIIAFANGKLSKLEAKVLMAQVNSCTACEEEARKVAQSEDVEDAFIGRMGW